jgi:hypothetical protein
MIPSVYLSLPREERAFIIASVQIKIESDKQEANKIKKRK